MTDKVLLWELVHGVIRKGGQAVIYVDSHPPDSSELRTPERAETLRTKETLVEKVLRRRHSYTMTLKPVSRPAIGRYLSTINIRAQE